MCIIIIDAQQPNHHIWQINFAEKTISLEKLRAHTQENSIKILISQMVCQLLDG